MPYVSAQQPSVSTQKTFMDTGPIRVRRFPPVLVIILIIAAVGLAGFAAFKAGWLEAPINNVQEFVSGIQLPQWLPIGSKDTTPPAISEVKVSGITQTGAVITWKTDEPATSQVMICEPAGGCTWTEPDENLATNHSVIISDLKSNITYHYTATSTDANKNQSLSEGDITTLAQAPTTALAISGIKVSNITDLSATISWQTDQPATSQLEYGTTDAYGSATPLDEKLTTSHSVTLAGLKPSTAYHFKVKSKDASGNEVASQDQPFTTRSTVSAAAEIGTEVGQLAPDFTLPTLDGKEVSLIALRGKIVIINFWQDVQQSRNELTSIQAVYGKWPQDKLAILAISWKQTPQVTQAVVDTKGLTLPILLDETGEVAAKYKVIQSPSTFFIDAQGIVKARKDFPVNQAQIEGMLNSMQ
jgi:peroxiredoxin